MSDNCQHPSIVMPPPSPVSMPMTMTVDAYLPDLRQKTAAVSQSHCQSHSRQGRPRFFPLALVHKKKSSLSMPCHVSMSIVSRLFFSRAASNCHQGCLLSLFFFFQRSSLQHWDKGKGEKGAIGMGCPIDIFFYPERTRTQQKTRLCTCCVHIPVHKDRY